MTRPHLSARHPDVAEQMTELGARVRMYRRMRGLSQERLAERVARQAAGFRPDKPITCDRHSINRLENAAYTPGLHRLFQLAQALDVHPAVLVGGRPPADLSNDSTTGGPQ